mmetsp:Transcript_139291/g.445329  ORF Transcript_139291/g.445329 Transcript_139291/m.445329 type:complete len:317 (+) Transcript_139291:220-1170(+)
MLEPVDDLVGPLAQLHQVRARILRARDHLGLRYLELLLSPLVHAGFLGQRRGDLRRQLCHRPLHGFGHQLAVLRDVLGVVGDLRLELRVVLVEVVLRHDVDGLPHVVAHVARQQVQPVEILMHILDGVRRRLLSFLHRFRLANSSLCLIHGHLQPHALHNALLDELRRHELPAALALREAWACLPHDHVLLVADGLEKGIPNIVQAHPVATLRLPISPYHLRYLFGQREALGCSFDITVGLHEDSQQDVQQQHEQQQHEGPEPQCTGEEPDLAHLLVLPISEQAPEASDYRPRHGCECHKVLAEKKHGVDGQAEVA